MECVLGKQDSTLNLDNTCSFLSLAYNQWQGEDFIVHSRKLTNQLILCENVTHFKAFCTRTNLIKTYLFLNKALYVWQINHFVLGCGVSTILFLKMLCILCTYCPLKSRAITFIVTLGTWAHSFLINCTKPKLLAAFWLQFSCIIQELTLLLI